MKGLVSTNSSKLQSKVRLKQGVRREVEKDGYYSPLREPCWFNNLSETVSENQLFQVVLCGTPVL